MLWAFFGVVLRALRLPGVVVFFWGFKGAESRRYRSSRGLRVEGSGSLGF